MKVNAKEISASSVLRSIEKRSASIVHKACKITTKKAKLHKKALL